MMYKFFLSIFLLITIHSKGQQQDTVIRDNVIVISDSRIGLLGKKMAEYNEGLSRKTRLGKGYRLMVLSTPNRNLAMNVRTLLIQLYPDQKVYTLFQSPNIRLKLGNFVEMQDAEKMRKEIMDAGIIEGNIYIVPETIEIKPEKVKETAD